MDPQESLGSNFGFKNVQLLKDQRLGAGAYGIVYKAKCDDLLCAAKVVYSYLIEADPTPQREYRLPIRRFEQECEFMSAIRHPNIVQYLGMSTAEALLPVQVLLIMELMDDNLTHFLESTAQPIPDHIQVNICHDISLALSFLHSNNIVHRDLSSNNVLLRGNVLAKVADFGMARLGDINPRVTRISNTMCPGTDVYMPPEAVQDKPVHTEKIDCFSFGVIIVQILTQQFPKPGDRLQEVTLNHPGLPRGTVCVRVPEIDRRQNHIGLVNPGHSLLSIALDCLKDALAERPSAHELCERVAALKESDEYDNRNAVSRNKVDTSDSELESKNVESLIQQIKDIQQIVESQTVRLQEKDRSIAEKVQLIKQKDEELAQLQREKDRSIAEEVQLIEQKDQELAQLERGNHQQLRQQVYRSKQHPEPRAQNHPAKSSPAEKLSSFKLRWRDGKKAPCAMWRGTSAVLNNVVYFSFIQSLFGYNVEDDTWFKLPDHQYSHYCLVAIDGVLTAIGGHNNHRYTNKLYCLIGMDSQQTWNDIFPPMLTCRAKISAFLCKTSSNLIIVGGEPWACSRVVEVMNTATRQWFTASPLHAPIFCASVAVCGDRVYLFGGRDKHKFSKLMYTCSLKSLLHSAPRLLFWGATTIWTQIDSAPVMRSTCVSFKNELLIFGGIDLNTKNSTPAVHMYNQSANSWEIVSHMTTDRYDCLTVVLPDGRIMVVGGFTSNDQNDSVEFGILE